MNDLEKTYLKYGDGGKGYWKDGSGDSIGWDLRSLRPTNIPHNFK
jgi:hypothetical protein